MNVLSSPAPFPITRVLCLCLALLGACRQAGGANPESHARPARVLGITGRAQFSREGAAYAPLASGVELKPGDIVRTATESAVDIDLGEGPGLVRLTESSTLALDKLAATAGAGDGPVFELALRNGELLGLVKRMPAATRVEIKTASGIARIIQGQFRIQSAGYLVLLEGKAIFAHVPPAGEPKAYILNAPPACYFAPAAGVKPAPRDLAREVSAQWRARIPQGK